MFFNVDKKKLTWEGLGTRLVSSFTNIIVSYSYHSQNQLVLLTLCSTKLDPSSVLIVLR